MDNIRISFCFLVLIISEVFTQFSQGFDRFYSYYHRIYQKKVHSLYSSKYILCGGGLGNANLLPNFESLVSNHLIIKNNPTFEQVEDSLNKQYVIIYLTGMESYKCSNKHPRYLLIFSRHIRMHLVAGVSFSFFKVAEKNVEFFQLSQYNENYGAIQTSDFQKRLLIYHVM